MYAALLIAIGGAIGTVLRYLLTQLAQRLYGSSMPGTLLVNVLGSFGVGLLLGIEAHDWQQNHWLQNNQDFIRFFELGVFGGFTTFSMFIFELTQRRSSNHWLSVSYIVVSIVFSMLAVLLGMFCGGGS